MTQDAMTAQVRRWQLVALLVIALLAGYIAGQLTPGVTAQGIGAKVQLDTSNCYTGMTTFYGNLSPLIHSLSPGAILIETVVMGNAVVGLYYLCN